MQPRRIALAASSFAPHIGGVEEHVRQLARTQTERGGEPTIMTMRWPKDLPRREIRDGIEVRRFLYRVPEGGLRRVAAAAPSIPLTVARVVRALRERESQLVHIHCVSHGAWYAARAARALRLPLVVTIHGELTMDADDIYGRSPRLRRTLRELLLNADAVTACSRATLTEAEDWLGRRLGSRASVVHSGVRTAEFDRAEPFRSPRPYVFGLGRLVEQKGFDVLLDAFAELARSAEFEADLILGGDGAERSALEQRTRQLGLEDRVRFLGMTDRATTASLFAGCDAFVLPSRREPLGIVNLEAMASRCAVVASNVGGVSEIVDDERTGLLVPPNDPVAIATQLRRLRGDPQLRQRLERAGRATAELLTWDRVAAEYEQIYERAVSSSSGAHS